MNFNLNQTFAICRIREYLPGIFVAEPLFGGGAGNQEPFVYRAFSHEVKAAMLVFQTNPERELNSFVFVPTNLLTVNPLLSPPLK